MRRHEGSVGTTPLGRASAVCGAARWGFTTSDALAALEDGIANTHGDHAIALRGVIFGHPVTQCFCQHRRVSKMRKGGMKSINGSCRGISVLPLRRDFRSTDPKRLPEDEMTLKVEVVEHGGLHAEKTLGRSNRFEALHLALSSSYHLVRVLGPIILAKLLFTPARCSGRRRRRSATYRLPPSLARSLVFSAACESASELRACIACVEPAHRGSPPSWSTARHGYIHLPAIRTTISSRCQRSLGRERHRHTRRAIIGPNFTTQLRTVS
jgi:hypothetical protein